MPSYMAWVAKTFEPQSLALGTCTACADPENGERSIVESFLPEMDGNELQVNAFCGIDARNQHPTAKGQDSLELLLCQSSRCKQTKLPVEHPNDLTPPDPLEMIKLAVGPKILQLARRTPNCKPSLPCKAQLF